MGTQTFTEVKLYYGEFQICQSVGRIPLVLSRKFRGMSEHRTGVRLSLESTMGPQGTWAQWRFRPLCQFVGESTLGARGPLRERHIQIWSVSDHTGTSNAPKKVDQMRRHFRRPVCEWNE